MRGRSYSCSTSPPRSSRRYRSPSPRDRYNGRDKDLPTSLLVCNLGRDCREPQGFGFIQYVYPADAKHYLDGEVIFGREIKVIFAEENRKKPSEMRARDRVRGRSYDEYRGGLRRVILVVQSIIILPRSHLRFDREQYNSNREL